MNYDFERILQVCLKRYFTPPQHIHIHHHNGKRGIVMKLRWKLSRRDKI